MRVVDLLRAVRDGAPVEPEGIKEFIQGIVSGDVPDYQSAAFLMAVYHRGLSDQLTVALTEAMRDSGRVVEHPQVKAPKVDKHSTGGVGDKISLPLAPAVAACGVPVPMISGRGLGHTGGTLDKLESIPGFRVDLGIERFQELVATLGLGLIGQTADLAPADKKLYALRDVTATVESIPLITASILSKKLAEGIDALVLDVKVGRGAFMKDEASGRALAESLVRVGSGAGLRMCALLTRMEEPLGRCIGNALEMVEALEILHGEGPPDTTELTVALGAEMLRLGGKASSVEEGRKKIQEALTNGTALAKMRAVVEAQGGDPKVVDDPSLLAQAPHRQEVHAPRAGFVHGIDSYSLGLAATQLGAGRARAEDTVDAAVGLEVLVRRGDPVEAGTPLARIHARQPSPHTEAAVVQAFSIADQPVAPAPLVLDRIVADP